MFRRKREVWGISETFYIVRENMRSEFFYTEGRENI
jgi:hypothetical protein